MPKESKPKPERELLINLDYRRAVIYKSITMHSSKSEATIHGMK